VRGEGVDDVGDISERKKSIRRDERRSPRALIKRCQRPPPSGMALVRRMRGLDRTFAGLYHGEGE